MNLNVLEMALAVAGGVVLLLPIFAMIAVPLVSVGPVVALVLVLAPHLTIADHRAESGILAAAILVSSAIIAVAAAALAIAATHWPRHVADIRRQIIGGLDTAPFPAPTAPRAPVAED